MGRQTHTETFPYQNNRISSLHEHSSFITLYTTLTNKGEPFPLNHFYTCRQHTAAEGTFTDNCCCSTQYDQQRASKARLWVSSQCSMWIPEHLCSFLLIKDCHQTYVICWHVDNSCLWYSHSSHYDRFHFCLIHKNKILLSKQLTYWPLCLVID